ncbi:MAG: TonB family protein [Dehalococcoidia bacterium]
MQIAKGTRTERRPGGIDPSDARSAASANDRFKAQSNRRLGRSMALAVLAHGALIAFSPAWSPSEVVFDRFRASSDADWILLLGNAWAPSGAIETVLSVVEDPGPEGAPGEREEQGRADGEASSPSQWEFAALSDAVRERLRVRPELASMLAEPKPTHVPTNVENPLRVDANASAADYHGAPGAGSPDLGRLSAVRPEIVLFAPSTWVLVENPDEVTAFLNRRLSGEDVDRRTSDAVSVALRIDEGGSVEWAEISDSSGSGALDEAVLELFRDVVSFRPARIDGVRVPVSVLFWLRLAP